MARNYSREGLILAVTFGALQHVPSSRCGVAGSGLRPVTKTPDCCHPKVFGPCLSSDGTDSSFEAVKRLRLGRPLPHQRSDARIAHRRPHGRRQVTMVVLPRSPVHSGIKQDPLMNQLACLRHTAKLHPEPGPNSRWLSSHEHERRRVSTTQVFAKSSRT